MTYLCVLAGIALVILAVRTLAKNFIANFNASDNGFITVFLIILILASFILPFCSFYHTTEYVQTTSVLQSKADLNAMEIAYFKEAISTSKAKMIYDVIYGYVCIIISLVILKIIKIRRNDACNSSNSKWDI